MRVLFLNENIGGHATVHHHLRIALAERDDIEPVLFDVPKAGFVRRALGVASAGLGRLDIDLQPLRAPASGTATERSRLVHMSLTHGFDAKSRGSPPTLSTMVLPGRQALESFRSVVQFKEFERDPVTRRLATVADIEDLRRVAKRRLPAGIFDYIDGGAEDERTLANNVNAFGRYEFRPRVLRDVDQLDTSTTLFGRTLPMPLLLSATGFSRIANSQGELAVARAAARAGLPYSLSTMATRSIEEVSAVSDGPKWFQVYTWKDRAMVADMIARAAAAGFEALTLTVDTAVLGRRERDVRRGYQLPPKIGLDTMVDGVLHPAWTLDFLRNEPITFANVVGYDNEDGSTAVTLADHVHRQFDQSLSWDDVAWLQSIWDGPIVLKGIQTVADAEQAAAAGVAGIALSNHGGRQLDDAPAPIDLVGPVAQAVGGQIAIICEGGVRRGSDIVKALALGADAVSIGRPYLYGLGAAGERGVDHVIDFFDDGLRRTMALCGVRTIGEITGDLVEPARR